jgi:hypothetical protein
MKFAICNARRTRNSLAEVAEPGRTIAAGPAGRGRTLFRLQGERHAVPIAKDPQTARRSRVEGLPHPIATSRHDSRSP